MCSVLGSAGYDVETAVDGADGLERVQRSRFDLMLIDFVMPRLNGYQVAQAMRAIPGLQRLPIVLVSAKAEQIGERFASQTGAAAVLQKPFTPQGLLDAVARSLEALAPPDADEDDPFAGLMLDESPVTDRPADGRLSGPSFAPPRSEPRVRRDAASAVQIRPSSPSIASSVRPAPASGAHPTQAPPRAAVEAAHARFTELLARDLVPAFQDVADTHMDVTEDAVLQILRFYLSSGRVAALYRELRPLEGGMRGNVVLDGLLDSVALGEVFQLLAFQSHTGLLVVDRGVDGSASVTFALRNGRIDLAVGRDMIDEFRLGRYLVEMGVVSRAHIDAVIESLSGQRVLIGQALVTGGFIREADLERALERQTSEFLYEVVRWSGGRFRFEAGSTLPEAQYARLGLPSETFILEGYRRLDEWRMIGEYLPSDRAVLARDEALVAGLTQHELHLNERRVLDAVDGARSVRDVIDAVCMSSFDTCKILYRLLQARLVAPVAA